MSKAAPTKKTFRELETERNSKVNDLETVPMHRVRYLMVNPSDFLMLFAEGLILAKRMAVFEGVPADAKVRNMTVDHVRGGIILVVESAEYEELPQTDMPPVQLIQISQGVVDATKSKKSKRKK